MDETTPLPDNSLSPGGTRRAPRLNITKKIKRSSQRSSSDGKDVSTGDQTLPAPLLQDISAEMASKIKEFREVPGVLDLLEERHGDHFIGRFLIATKMDVLGAVKMFQERQTWRAKNGVDEIFTTWPENPQYEMLLNYWPGSQHFWADPPKTYDGSIVLLEKMGTCDPTVLDAIGLETFMQFHIWCMESMERLWFDTVEEMGYWPGFVLIEDLQGSGMHSFSSAVLAVFQVINNINQNYYPAMLRKVYMINVPSVFYIFWKALSVMIDPRTVAKVEMNNGSACTIKSKLDEIIDPNVLPERLGGNLKRDIPNGGILNIEFRTPVDKFIEISRSGSHEVVHLFEEGDHIFWEFSSKSYDIGFCVFFLGHEKDQKKEILPFKRFEAFKMVITGHHTVVDAGHYQFTFDNSFSWTKGKQIKFNIYKGSDLL